jgi:two-component system response regulator PhcR
MNGLDHAAAILYVDAEETACKYFVRSIACEYEVITATTVEDALDILQSEGDRIGILVSDYRLPGNHGGELLRRTQLAHPCLVCVMVTAYADKDMLLKTINSSEIFRVLEKPLDMAEVRSTLMLARDLWQKRIAGKQKLMAIDETLAFLAHEINAPLAKMIALARDIARRLEGVDKILLQRREIEFATVAISDHAEHCLSVLSGLVESVRNSGIQVTNAREAAASQIISSLLDTYPLSPDQRALIHVDIKRDFRIPAFPNCVSLVLAAILTHALRRTRSRALPQICVSASVNDGQPQIRVERTIAESSLDSLACNLEMTSFPAQNEGDNGDSDGIVFCDRIMRTFGGNIALLSSDGGMNATSVILNFPMLKSTYD